MAANTQPVDTRAPEDIVDTPTLDPPGRVVDAELVAGEQLRVTIRNVERERETAWERVEADPHRNDLLQCVRALCNGPDASSTPSTMAKWPAIQGRLAEVHGLNPTESEQAARRAIEARDLSCVRWDGRIEMGSDAEGTRCVFPIEESSIRRVIAEFASADAPRGDLIEHCQALLEEVDGDD